MLLSWKHPDPPSLGSKCLAAIYWDLGRAGSIESPDRLIREGVSVKIEILTAYHRLRHIAEVPVRLLAWVLSGAWLSAIAHAFVVAKKKVVLKNRAANKNQSVGASSRLQRPRWLGIKRRILEISNTDPCLRFCSSLWWC